MDTLPDLDGLLAMLHTRGSLRASGMSDRAIQTAVRRGEVLRLSPGWFLTMRDWTERTLVEQHLLRALCAHFRATRAPIFSHETGAAILGLPLLRFDAAKVHTLQPRDGRNDSSADVLRHRQDFDERDVHRSGGLLHTSPERTLIDVARTSAFEQGIVVGDAVLRRLAGASRHSQETHRTALIRQLAALPGTRGHRRANRVLRFLDSAADSPLESLYRLQFARLGFEVRTQAPVRSPSGGVYRMDFELVGYRTFFEADGRAKYTEAEYRNGKSPDGVLLAEKKREDWVRGTTDYRVLRGGWSEALTPHATAAHLRAFGIAPPVDPRTRTILDLH
ncbi:hypothetical protein J4H92_14195 [Leucobacter weissii]|uniref:Transcriptional regulator, AbiEi antitoxin, Type IV TA system n=1 Tax=Leucobacter weissii TaxID=1983706 RepID=A0A939MM53_9MICO|nr:hypothetical protein [Leucobacter weissii]MBO1903091.1 hypothetical protein [Leucobacter weissii]